MTEEMVITVASKTAKEKGGFTITDTIGNAYIVSLKNALVAEKLEEGRASKISVAPTSYGKFINSAELFDGKPPAEQQVAPITAGVEKPKPSTTQSGEGDAKIRSMALAYAKDVAVALINSGAIKEFSGALEKRVIEVATLWSMWIKGDYSVDSKRIVELIRNIAGNQEDS